MDTSTFSTIVTELGTIWATIFSWDFGRYLVGGGGIFLLVWVLLGRRLQSRKIRAKTPKPKQMWAEFKASAITAAVFGLVGTISHMGVTSGFLQPIYGEISEYGWAYFLFSLVAVIVLHDAYFYWTHRLMHVRAVLKRAHYLHHRSHNPTPWAAYSFDMVEAAVQAAFVPIFLFFFPLHGLAMFLFLAHMIIRNGMGHSGYELFPRRWAVHPIFGWLTLVTHHDMHHENGNYNFGLYFSWWDRLMGTEHPDYLARVTGDKARSRQPADVTEAKENA